MPFDALCVNAMVYELNKTIVGKRIDRILQPLKDHIVLAMRNDRLLLCANPSFSRIQWTDINRENPQDAPMFCMLLRKYLSGAKVVSVEQPTLERIVFLRLQGLDDFGQTRILTLALEMIGRKSNLVLIDSEGRIIDCMRKVDADISATRQILPGLFYELPPAPDKLNILEETDVGFYQKMSNYQGSVFDGFLQLYFGLSPLLIREIIYHSEIEADEQGVNLNQVQIERLYKEMNSLQNRIQEHRYDPCIFTDNTGKPDYAAIPIEQYKGKRKEYSSLSELLDIFYAEKEKKERIRQNGAELQKCIQNNRERLRRKLEQQIKDYDKSLNREKDRMYGDLLTSYLYQIKRGENKFTCNNYYDDNNEITIVLDPLLTPQENAAKYYKKYSKAKTAEKYLKEQMEIASRDITYLDSVEEALKEVELDRDFQEIREELIEAGFLKKHLKKEKQKKKQKIQLKRVVTSKGYTVYIGRNNIQNDELTFKLSQKNDVWFHTQKIHGSHTVLKTDGMVPDEDTIVEVAKIAAYYSQGRDSANVPVDYTLIKNVKKIPGSRPGMVQYNNFHTVNVFPSNMIEEKVN